MEEVWFWELQECWDDVLWWGKSLWKKGKELRSEGFDSGEEVMGSESWTMSGHPWRSHPGTGAPSCGGASAPGTGNPAWTQHTLVHRAWSQRRGGLGCWWEDRAHGLGLEETGQRDSSEAGKQQETRSPVSLMLAADAASAAASCTHPRLPTPPQHSPFRGCQWILPGSISYFAWACACPVCGAVQKW